MIENRIADLTKAIINLTFLLEKMGSLQNNSDTIKKIEEVNEKQETSIEVTSPEITVEDNIKLKITPKVPFPELEIDNTVPENSPFKKINEVIEFVKYSIFNSVNQNELDELLRLFLIEKGVSKIKDIPPIYWKELYENVIKVRSLKEEWFNFI